MSEELFDCGFVGHSVFYVYHSVKRGPISLIPWHVVVDVVVETWEYQRYKTPIRQSVPSPTSPNARLVVVGQLVQVESFAAGSWSKRSGRFLSGSGCSNSQSIPRKLCPKISTVLSLAKAVTTHTKSSPSEFLESSQFATPNSGRSAPNTAKMKVRRLPDIHGVMATA